MKKSAKIVLWIAFGMILAITYPRRAYAVIGDMGFFGGISEGERLPTTTEIKIKETGTNARQQAKTVSKEYKEIIAIDGVPMEFEGLITVTDPGPDTTKTAGSYNMKIVIEPSSTTGDAVLYRDIEFQATWRKEGQQYVKNLTPTRWTETIVVPDNTEDDTTAVKTYILDSRQSSFSVSLLEDHTPGVTYFTGDTSGHSVYTSTDEDGNTFRTVIDLSDRFYGYTCAWSKTETHSSNITVMTDTWQLQYLVTPSVTSNKTLQYTYTEPTAISFPGNYREILQTESWLRYNINVKPNAFYYIPDSGSALINIPNIPEQLIAPSLNFLRGHPAEHDIAQLFSMQILDGVATDYQPAQAITRAQYTSAIVRAVKIPIETVQPRTAKNPAVYVLFSDVPDTRPDYPFILAAYKAGITLGKDNASFSPDDGLELQEAVAIMVRTLGLENLAPDPTPMTPFADDYKVASWARSELYAAYRLGIIAPDENFEIHPNDIVSKAGAAALINRLINYMRDDLAIDYTSHIVGYGG